MNAALSEAIKEAYASAPSNVAVLETLEISHPSIGGTIYIVKNREDLTLTLEDDTEQLFEGVGFRMALPASGDNGVQELTITIDNVDRRISDFLNTAKDYQTPVVVKYRPYLSNDLTTPQMENPIVLFLTDVRVTVFEINAKASFADILNKKFPTQLYTRSRFPSIGN
jgi:hypothetical protein